MTVYEACALSVVRMLVIAALAAVLAPPLVRLVQAPPRLWARRLLWALLMLPLLTPPILVGYGWSNLSVRLAHDSFWQQALYSLLVLGRLTPAAALVLALSPRPAASAEAIHCHRLLRRGPSWSLWVRGPARARLAAGVVVALLAFSEFEIASLMNISAWTVWVFDAQAGGLPLGHTLRATAVPLALQALGVSLALAALWPQRGSEAQVIGEPPQPSSPATLALAALWLLAALVLNVAAPVAIVLPGAWRGGAPLWDDLAIAPDLQHSLIFSAVAATLALAIVLLAARLPRTVAAALCVPGLLGSLVIGLLVLACFQTPVLRPLYDTPLPLVLALLLLLLPTGIVLGSLLGTLGRGEPVHAAHLLAAEGRGRRWASALKLNHELVGRAWWGLAIILFYLAYFDLPASALLAPSGLTPSIVRLYNLMHYGHIATLSAMVMLVLTLPLAMLLAGAGLHRLWMLVRARRGGAAAASFSGSRP